MSGVEITIKREIFNYLYNFFRSKWFLLEIPNKIYLKQSSIVDIKMFFVLNKNLNLNH